MDSKENYGFLHVTWKGQQTAMCKYACEIKMERNSLHFGVFLSLFQDRMQGNPNLIKTKAYHPLQTVYYDLILLDVPT